MKSVVKNYSKKGFTLIELMITVAIVGILAAIALPAYQDYTVRAQVSEATSLLDGTKTPIAEYYADKGEFPADNAAAGYAGAVGKYVSGVVIAGNAATDVVVTATFGTGANANIQSKTLQLSGTPDASGVLVWTCAAGATGGVDAKYLPSSCK